MARHVARGTKRKCQNEGCALPFYDLNRADYTCPNCGAAFDAHVSEQLPTTARYLSRPPGASPFGSSRRKLEEPAQSEELEPAAATEEEADEPEDEHCADPILEEEEGEEDSIVVSPSPDGRVED